MMTRTLFIDTPNDDGDALRDHRLGALALLGDAGVT